MLGYETEEVLDYGFWKLTQDEEFEKIDYNVKFIPDSVHVRKLKTKSGDYRFIQWSDFKYSDNLFIATGHDITQKIIAEKEYQTLIQNAPDIIYDANKYGVITLINDATSRVLGFEKEEVIGKHFTSFLSNEEKREALEFYVPENKNQNDFEAYVLPVKHKNGQTIWFSQKVRIKRDLDDNLVGFSCVMRDITNTRKLEEQIIDKNNILTQLSKYTNKLIQKDNIDEIFDITLGDFTKAIKADRVCYYEFDEQENLVNQKFEWFVENEVLTINKVDFQGINPKDYEEIFEALFKNKTYQIITEEVKDLNYKKRLQSRGILSALLVPVFHIDKLIGYLGFDNFEEVRVWDKEENYNFRNNLANNIDEPLLLELRIKKLYKKVRKNSNY
ncbi:MAG: PAS domain S-box protein [Flavobacterium sp.]|nr:PAS domain S-box protein [Flavobacterium sp.]